MQRVHKTIDTKSRRICSVPQCSTYCTVGISLHTFPLEPTLCEKWRQTLRIGKPVSKYMTVCSKHFLAEDYIYETGYNKRRRLKRGKVPSQSLPMEKVAKPLEKVMLFSQEDLLVSDEYDKLLQVSCRDEEDLINSDYSPSPRKNKLTRDSEEKPRKKQLQIPSGCDDLLEVKVEEEIKPQKRKLGRDNLLEKPTKKKLQVPSGYDNLLEVRYEEEIKPVKRRSGRRRKKVYKHEDVETENIRSIRSNAAKKKRLDQDGEFRTRNGHPARRGRHVGSKNVKLEKVQISDEYYDLLHTSTTYKEEFGINLKPSSHISNKPQWYVEFVDKGTQTDLNNEKPSIKSKYIDRSTQTTTFVKTS